MKHFIIMCCVFLICLSAPGATEHRYRSFINNKFICTWDSFSNENCSMNDWIMVIMLSRESAMPPENEASIGRNKIKAITLGKHICLLSWESDLGIMNINQYAYDLEKGRVFLVSPNGKIGQIKIEKSDDVLRNVIKEQKKVDGIPFTLFEDGESFVSRLVAKFCKESKRLDDYIKNPSVLSHDPVKPRHSTRDKEWVRKRREMWRKKYAGLFGYKIEFKGANNALEVTPL